MSRYATFIHFESSTENVQNVHFTNTKTSTENVQDRVQAVAFLLFDLKCIMVKKQVQSACFHITFLMYPAGCMLHILR